MKGKKINLIIAVILTMVFVKLALIASEYKAEEGKDLAVILNLEGDFPNPREGTAMFDMRLFMENIILVNNKVPKYVTFTESKIIPGLILRYNVHDSVFEGGLPLIKSEEVVFLDGNKHKIAYTFKEGGEQKFYFDGREIGSSKFDSSKIGATGFAVRDMVSVVKIINVEGNAEFS